MPNHNTVQLANMLKQMWTYILLNNTLLPQISWHKIFNTIIKKVYYG